MADLVGLNMSRAYHVECIVQVSKAADKTNMTTPIISCRQALESTLLNRHECKMEKKDKKKMCVGELGKAQDSNQLLPADDVLC